jgi:hypothetical protein
LIPIYVSLTHTDDQQLIEVEPIFLATYGSIT